MRNESNTDKILACAVSARERTNNDEQENIGLAMSVAKGAIANSEQQTRKQAHKQASDHDTDGWSSVVHGLGPVYQR